MPMSVVGLEAVSVKWILIFWVFHPTTSHYGGESVEYPGYMVCTHQAQKLRRMVNYHTLHYGCFRGDVQ